MIRRRHYGFAIFAVLMAASLIAFAVYVVTGSRDRSALWHIVHDRCLRNWESRHDFAPCADLDVKEGVERGTAVLKDRNGKAQFLAMPTRAITGVESPALGAGDAPDLFGAAWDARRLVFERLGKELPRDGVGLAINSAWARSQDQAHIHVDCLRPDVRDVLAKRVAGIASGWMPEPIVLSDRPYKVLRIDGADLGGRNPFKLVAEGLREARDNMGRTTIVVVGESFANATPGFLVLVDFADTVRGDVGHGEDLLDHACSLARQD
ncbi:CDP-diacylglycerol diphosphatase [Hyphomicrobium sp. 2TAF46]|uniref:CDP-diacylglycerol pyrophosphatase n=1 Tax=Hyphomicrobium sp. 2TAF46 TaxID=3233019 RepID=UPI003F916226